MRRRHDRRDRHRGAARPQSLYNLRTAARAELLRIELNEKMAALFDEVDFVIAATNPGPAFDAAATTSNPSGSTIQTALSGAAGRLALPSRARCSRAARAPSQRPFPNLMLDAFSRRNADFVAMGGLTVISNVYGNPAVSIPAGTVRGLPVGLQVLAPHHHDELLFDVARIQERHRPWPLVAPNLIG